MPTITKKLSNSSNLPIECWQEILKHVPVEDVKTLWSCLMVNRSMCKIVTPILWSNPFHHLQKGSRRKQPSRRKKDEEIKLKVDQKNLINVYISCMEKTSIKILHDHEIRIKRKSHLALTTFDYPSFLRELRYDIICESSSSWLWPEQLLQLEGMTELGILERIREYRKLLLTRELCKMFIKKSPLITTLTLSYYVPFSDKSFKPPEDYFLINKFPGANISLKNLKRFKCSLLIDQWKEISKDLTRICGKNGGLESLELKCIGEPSVEWVDDKSFINVCELIKQQKSLQHVKLNCCGKYCNMAKVVSTLSTHTDHIKSLEFIHLKFNSHSHGISTTFTNCSDSPLHFISECKGLNSLIFKDCDELDYKVFAAKNVPWFDHLTKLVFEDTSISPFDISRIISSCHKLHELSCDLGEDFGYLPEFALNLPLSLKHLSIDAIEIDVEILQSFLENIKASLESLKFPAWICRSFTDQHLYIICDELKNSLKRLDLDLMAPENQQHGVSLEAIQYARRKITSVNIECYFSYDSW
ncbi:6626_t:CDS:1 [Funneliformis mosseae]|uniref:6626_t:CDS:1 n=1 Tax=Funneliformis mosseae TaxID=27381 RepID=A0A9N8V7Q0_FUNMO|nr:6626_t:CDS:1 [Funneliformis mosseae]